MQTGKRNQIESRHTTGLDVPIGLLNPDGSKNPKLHSGDTRNPLLRHDAERLA